MAVTFSYFLGHHGQMEKYDGNGRRSRREIQGLDHLSTGCRPAEVKPLDVTHDRDVPRHQKGTPVCY